MIVHEQTAEAVGAHSRGDTGSAAWQPQEANAPREQRAMSQESDLQKRIECNARVRACLQLVGLQLVGVRHGGGLGRVCERGRKPHQGREGG
jgi:hypothetical protein